MDMGKEFGKTLRVVNWILLAMLVGFIGLVMWAAHAPYAVLGASFLVGKVVSWALPLFVFVGIPVMIIRACRNPMGGKV